VRENPAFWHRKTPAIKSLSIRTALVKLPRRISPKPIINDCAAWPTPVSTKTSFVTARRYCYKHECQSLCSHNYFCPIIVMQS
ncbi:TPA_asm: hypothetical protein GBV39_22895, partial [Salmonella enterica subsp. enterica serovar Infantis]|nr:hypothetical protein [Salmonella enterica subsp. enterica serovar Infantis]